MKPLPTITVLLFGLSGLFCHADTGVPLSVSTPTRPQLSSTEQGSYTMATFLDGWVPEDVCTPSRGDYVVGSKGAYATVQAAVNAAINAGGTARKYIEIQSGTYIGLVVVPSGVPLTIYGASDRREDECRDDECRDSEHEDSDRRGDKCQDGVGRDSASRVVLQLNAHDVMTGPELAVAVDDSEDFGPSAPAKVSSYYNDCTTRTIHRRLCAKLSGVSSYVIHFAPGQTPPAHGFWSITVYDQQGRLVPNSINRGDVGSETGLVSNPDGSLDIFLQETEPSTQLSNWLPVPAGPFDLTLRVYWPDQTVLSETWCLRR
jgi:Protein of unknown function (DUF1214)